jgi:murein DD-endopeptidase MepM/ murein hydrolase activator NlpD
MKRNNPTVFRKIAYGIMLFSLFISILGAGNLSTAQAQEGSSGGVDYLIPEADQLSLEAKDAIALALTNWQYEAPKNGRFSVLSLRQETNWALATIASADLITHKPVDQEASVSNGRLVPLVLVFDNGKWKAAVKGDRDIQTLLNLIPESELSAEAKSALFFDPSISSNQAYNNYKFPWASGKAWIVRGTWHGSNNRALDFRPADNTNADVLAAAPGYITALAQCNPSDHYILNITTENTSEYLGYTHLTGESVRAEGLQLGDYVAQGQKLGVMAGAFSGADSCGIASSGMHLHVLMATKPFTMDGKTFSDSYWYDGVDLYSTQNGPSTIFADVPATYWAWNYIERLYNAGITGGCGSSPLTYCPENTVTRAQMAVFLLRGEHGSAYTPPNASGTVFSDVPSTYWAANWIEQLASEGITSGCGTGVYCPETPVTRAQMAVFLLRAKHGSAYAPPVAAGIFTDVPADYWAAAWIEQLAAEGITSGCGSGAYCPDQSVTRAQMAVFLVKTFNLP